MKLLSQILDPVDLPAALLLGVEDDLFLISFLSDWSRGLRLLKADVVQSQADVVGLVLWL